MSEGTLVELDPDDALGWIELDDGTRVRIGGTVLGRVQPLPTVGTRLRVIETTTGYQGVLKAAAIESLEPDPDAPRKLTWEDVARTHPQWSDLHAVTLRPNFDLPRLELPDHEWFGPWKDELVRTAAVSQPLIVPGVAGTSRVDPAPERSFALGNVAFLDDDDWPCCGRCDEPMEMCIQLAPGLLEPFTGDGRAFTVLFCFACGVEHDRDPAVAYLRYTTGNHRVTRPQSADSKSSRPLTASQQVTALDPICSPPPTGWYQLRAEHSPKFASSVLFFDDVCIDDTDAQDRDDEYVHWSCADERDVFERAFIGGTPSWDQADATPSCLTHGPMKLLLDYNGGQFLDGAIHIFTCGNGACPLQFCAEF